MSLQAMYREMVLEAVLRRVIRGDDAEVGRLQLIVDDEMLGILNSFLKMGDLHAEGVTSMEFLARPREALPGLDALYLVSPSEDNVDLLLADYKTEGAPQHRHVHLVLSQILKLDLMTRLAESKTLAPRLKSLLEVPLSARLIQGRGFHFNMLEALPALFPVADPGLAATIAHRLSDVCRVLQATAPSIRHGASAVCRSVAELVQSELSLCDRGPQEQQVPCTVLLLDRSVDVAATLVHEYTYEAISYDLLDGSVLDIDRNLVTLTGPPMREVLLTEADKFWERSKHRHIEDVKAALVEEIETLRQGACQQGSREISTAELLDMLRRSPQERETMERLDVHQSMLAAVHEQLQAQSITSVVGFLEQDVACGVDNQGKDVKDSSLQAGLRKAFNETADTLSSETRLRLLMLYFACLDNISEVVRTKLIEMARLDPEDQAVLMAMVRSKLIEVPEAQRHRHGTGCVHRVTKEQAARFKRNAAGDRFVLSRFEPRIKELLEQLMQGHLKEGDFPTLQGGGSAAGSLRVAGAAGVAPPGAPAAPDSWSFGGWPGGSQGAGVGAGEGSKNSEIKERIVVFIVGGITHSELRAADELMQSRPRGTEILVGGTALLTPRRFMRALAAQTRRQRADFIQADVHGVDLT